jgi:hypothetical protein
MPAGPAPTAIELPATCDFESIGDTVPSPVFETQIVFASTAIPSGRNPQQSAYPAFRGRVDPYDRVIAGVDHPDPLLPTAMAPGRFPTGRYRRPGWSSGSAEKPSPPTVHHPQI